MTAARHTRLPRAKKGTIATAAQQSRPSAPKLVAPKKSLLKVADIATFLSLACGVLAFLFALRGELTVAGIMLILCLIFDGIDGKIARLMKQQSDFGMYLDSLADAVAFGMVPAAIAIALVPSAHQMITVLAAIVFVCAGVFRLARFQYTRLQGEFQGVPITVNGVAFGLVLIFAPPSTFAWLFPAYFIVMAALMASTLRVKKL